MLWFSLTMVSLQPIRVFVHQIAAVTAWVPLPVALSNRLLATRECARWPPSSSSARKLAISVLAVIGRLVRGFSINRAMVS